MTLEDNKIYYIFYNYYGIKSEIDTITTYKVMYNEEKNQFRILKSINIYGDTVITDDNLWYGYFINNNLINLEHENQFFNIYAMFKCNVIISPSKQVIKHYIRQQFLIYYFKNKPYRQYMEHFKNL